MLKPQASRLVTTEVFKPVNCSEEKAKVPPLRVSALVKAAMSHGNPRLKTWDSNFHYARFYRHFPNYRLMRKI